jgi:hypothetical protein
VLPNVDTLEKLSGPFELLEMAHGESITLSPVKWLLGKSTITPRDGRAPKDVPTLRVWVTPESKRTEPKWWDITSQHTIAGLIGLFEGAGGRLQRYKVTREGQGPRGRPIIEVLPA